MFRATAACHFLTSWRHRDRPADHKPGDRPDRTEPGPARERGSHAEMIEKKLLDLRKVSLAVQKLLGAPKIFFWHLSQKPFKFQAPSPNILRQPRNLSNFKMTGYHRDGNVLGLFFLRLKTKISRPERRNLWPVLGSPQPGFPCQ